jgi:hypothetical protein
MPVSDLSKESLNQALQRLSVRRESIQQLMAVIDVCEFARYASSSAQGDMKSVYDQSITLITTLDSEINKGKRNKMPSGN